MEKDVMCLREGRRHLHIEDSLRIMGGFYEKYK